MFTAGLATAADSAGEPGRSSGKKNPLLFVVVLMVLFTAMPANADEIRPALLDIKEQNTGLFVVTFVLSLVAVLKRLPLTAPQGA